MIKTPALLIASLLLASELSSQDVQDVARLSSPVFLDGIVNEQAWKEIQPLPLTMYTPVYEGEMTEESEIRIGYDDQFIYASAVFHDSDPNGILANSLVRDVDKGGDFFNILLDTYNDNENFYSFTTTPAGNRIDAEITNDAEGSFTAFFNQDWNAYWDTKVRVTESGWSAESRIPFSSLKFVENDGEVIFGFIAHRLIGRKNERHTYPAILPNWEMAPWKASQASKIRFTGIRKKKPLYITPYVLGGYQENGESSEITPGKTSFKKEAGLDLKYGISNNLNLDITVNTDFAQVEVDDQQVNLSRFSLFFPEKRQFFQERAGIFSFGLGSQNRLFYSRRIGISPGGDPLRMYGGLRLTGRINNLDIGFLNSQVAENELYPSENFGVLRVRQRAFNKYSFVGGMATSKIDENGNSNVNYGLDGVVRLSQQYYLTFRAGQTLDSNQSSTLSDNSFLYTLLEKRATNKLGYEIELSRFGKDFQPEVGFNLRNDVTSFRQNIWYGIFMDQHPIIRILSPWVEVQTFVKNGGGVESQTATTGINFDLKSGTVFWASAKRTVDKPLQSFNLSEEVSVNPGNYDFYSFVGNYTTTQGQRIGVTANVELGEFYDGKITSLQLSPRWTVSKHLDFVSDLIYNRVKFDSKAQLFKGNIGRFRINMALNNYLSMNSFIQFNQADQSMGINLRLRYNFREGTDLFVVFNQGNTTDNNSEVSSLINRSVLIKYTHSFVNN